MSEMEKGGKQLVGGINNLLIGTLGRFSRDNNCKIFSLSSTLGRMRAKWVSLCVLEGMISSM
jgi:hypothetical protein